MPLFEAIGDTPRDHAGSAADTARRADSGKRLPGPDWPEAIPGTRQVPVQKLFLICVVYQIVERCF